MKDEEIKELKKRIEEMSAEFAEMLKVKKINLYHRTH
jgi:hypothetical protein